jgi:hypothetical protein
VCTISVVTTLMRDSAVARPLTAQWQPRFELNKNIQNGSNEFTILQSLADSKSVFPCSKNIK